MSVYKLDSIEDGIAAVESPEGLMLYFDASRLPEGAKSGDCFRLYEEKFIPDEDEAALRRKENSKLLEGIMNKKI